MSDEPRPHLRPPVLGPVERGAVTVLEHFLGRYYEGPDLPARFADEVRVFAMATFPGAATVPGTDAYTWMDFAHALARSAWQQAFVRGAEWRERREAGLEPLDYGEEAASMFDDPEMAAALELAVALDPLAAGVPGAAVALDHVGEVTGGFRVVGEGEVPRA